MPRRREGNTTGKASSSQQLEPAQAAGSVAVRLPAELVKRIDAWAGERDASERADVVCALVELGLMAVDARGAAPELRERAAALAVRQIDQMSDATATAEQRESRKSRLTGGPSMVRDLRRDRPVRKDED